MNQIYFGEFTCLDDVAKVFASYHDGAPYGRNHVDEDAIRAELNAAEVLFAAYILDYEGKAVVLFRAGSDLMLVESTQCSCFGLDGTWMPVRVVPEVLGRIIVDYDRTSAAQSAWREVVASLSLPAPK